MEQSPFDALLSDEFESEASWLNTVLSSSETSSIVHLDQSLARTLALLEVATHDTSALVDRTIDEIARSVPRLTFDLQLMRENALLLRSTLDGIRNKSTTATGAAPDATSPPEQGVNEVMEKLRVLDLAKSRMEAARDVLREAESWSTLESEVTALVGEQAYSKAAERLEEAARSMVVFQNTTEYEGRRALMVSLQNQLEASLSAPLVAAINSRDLKACKTFYSIFEQIQREAEFTAYYFGSRRAPLIEAWSSAHLVDCPSPSPSSSSTIPSSLLPSSPTHFIPFLSKFYNDLHALLSEERTYVPAIFPSAHPVLSSFIQTTLEGLSPSLPHRLSSIAEFHGPLFLPELIKAYKATEEFALVVERMMNSLLVLGGRNDSPPPSLSSPATPSTPTMKKDRRLSKRMSMSKRHTLSRSLSFGGGTSVGGPPLGLLGGAESGNASLVGAGSGGGGGGEEYVVQPWETAIFEPFLDWQVDYPELEKRYMKAAIAKETKNGNAMESLMSGKVERGAKLLWEMAQTVFTLAEEAVGRSIALTHGYGAKGLVDVVDVLLAEFMEERRIELVRAHQRGVKSTGRMKKGQDEDEEEAALEGLEYSTEDWTAFQFGLRLLQTCRSITEKHSALEGRLRSRLGGVARTISGARNDSTYTIPGTTRGAITLLRQSTLNSLELAALLDPLEAPLSSSVLDPLHPPSPFLPLSPHPHPHSHSQPPPPSSSIPNSLLPKSRGATTEFTRATQLFLHETILAPLLAHFTEYLTLPVWTTTSEQRPGGKGAFDLSIPTFSLSPTETISRVGEGLFNLPRLFEVYANDDALSFSIETLPFVDPESLHALQVVVPLSSPPLGAPASPRPPGHRLSFSEQVVLPGSVQWKPLPGGTTTRLAPPLAPSSSSSSSVSMSRTPSFAPLSAETVIATWLSSLTLSVLSHLTVVVLPSITRLSRHGAAQLASDLSYIANVARALDVDTPEDVESWREAVELDGKADEDSAIDRAVLEKVARARGVRKN